MRNVLIAGRLVALLLGLAACSSPTTLTVSLSSAVELKSASTSVRFDGALVVDAFALSLPTQTPAIGDLGKFGVRMKDASGIASVRVDAVGVDDLAYVALGEIDVVPHRDHALSLLVTAVPALTLSVVVDGSGTGKVTGSAIDCPSTCMENFAEATTVTLTATAGEHSAFDGWQSGPCQGLTTPTCEVAVTEALTVTARFSLVPVTLTLSKVVGIAGAASLVSSSPTGISCDPTCSATFPYGTTVTLVTAPEGSSYVTFEGDCIGQGSCSLTLTADATVTATMRLANFMFVTSTVQSPNLGGLVGADALCQTRATAGGLPGTYRAWLSTSTVDAKTRFTTAQGWMRPDRKPFANSLQTLAVLYPPRVDEFGSDLFDSALPTVMTGTNGAGVASGANASDWTSIGSVAGGSLLAGPSDWSGGSTAMNARIYCFGIDLNHALAQPPPNPLRKAFVSVAAFSSSAGIAAADEICQTEGSARFLSGTYKALLATSTQPARARFDESKGPWTRLDGIPVSRTVAEFFDDPMRLEAPVTLRSDLVIHGNNLVSTGAASPSVVSEPTQNCHDWTSNLVTDTRIVGSATYTNGRHFDYGYALACSTSVPVYCLEE